MNWLIEIITEVGDRTAAGSIRGRVRPRWDAGELLDHAAEVGGVGVEHGRRSPPGGPRPPPDWLAHPALDAGLLGRRTLGRTVDRRARRG